MREAFGTRRSSHGFRGMTTRTELLEIIANGGNSGVALRRDDLDARALAKELAAFSNLEGGMVLLGAEDDGTITGLMRDDLEGWVMNVCRDRIRPAIVPFFEVFRDVGEKRDIAIVRVTCGYGVHAFRDDDTDRYPIRVGSRSREASREELVRLFSQRGSVRDELRPVSGATLLSLDRRRLRNYFVDVRRQDVPADEDGEAWQSLLANTGIMTGEGVTVAGMLLFGTMPNRFLPHAGIDAVAYPGPDRHPDARERAKLRGPMTPLPGEDGDIVDNGLVEQALEFVQRNTHPVVETRGERRLERPAYPRDTLREGIVNALVHRDCQLTGHTIGLAVFSDRLEIVSPGRLPNGMTPDRMRYGTRAVRNQMLKDVMSDYDCRYLEPAGRGIPRIIVWGMEEHNGTEPALLERDERFTLRLYAQGQG